MASVRVISTDTIKAPSQNNNNNNDTDSTTHQKIDLTPWDLQFLSLETIQKGLLFHHPLDNNNNISKSNQINHLKHTLSSTLSFFPPLAGRLVITQHQDNNTCSCFLACNNAGALFIHAEADNTTVSDILKPNYVPTIVHSFFPLNGVINHEGTSQPLLAVQVTELLDGIFIGCTVNHVVADGKSFWHFVNSWAEISRGGRDDKIIISKLPSLQRWFLNDTPNPILFPYFTKEKEPKFDEEIIPKLPERIFHFTKENILQLKTKANQEANTVKISSLLAVLAHVWRSVIRSKQLNPQEEVIYVLIVGVRTRLIPPLAENYFGNAALAGVVVMKAGGVVAKGGLGNVAMEMNKMISLYSDEKIKENYESWVRTPRLLTLANTTAVNSLTISSCPRFDIYGNDFGWGKPLAVRSGVSSKSNGMINVFAGVEEGSMDIELCLASQILEAMGNDNEFMDAISSH